jgi:probable H4MPT-linked C1 transfer pathway protein
VIRVVGWDIGGANIKAALVAMGPGQTNPVKVASRPFEIWREKKRLPEILHAIFSDIVADSEPQSIAITMTAELSDIFSTKREGVLFILQSIRSCFPRLPAYVLSLSGDFTPLEESRTRPLDFAATNWLASARWIARQFPNCLLVDAGSTTTDILPILDGQVCVVGRTDTERLSSGELVFTGILRTNLAAVVQSAPVRGRKCRVASEYFAISADVHLILGNLGPQDYSCTTPDGRPPSVDSARSRLARLVCADIEMLSASEIDEMARYVYAQQIRQVCDGMHQVLSRLPRLRRYPVIVSGSGAFLGSAAARSIGLETIDLKGILGSDAAAVTPCVAAAHLLAEHLKGH